MFKRYFDSATFNSSVDALFEHYYGRKTGDAPWQGQPIMQAIIEINKAQKKTGPESIEINP